MDVVGSNRCMESSACQELILEAMKFKSFTHARQQQMMFDSSSIQCCIPMLFSNWCLPLNFQFYYHLIIMPGWIFWKNYDELDPFPAVMITPA